MGTKKKQAKILAAIVVLASLVATYQNCGPTPGGAFNFGYGSNGLPSGSIPPGTQVRVTGRIAGGYYHTCAINAAGGVQCWGAGAQGQLGYGADVAYSASAVTVIGLSGTVVKLSAGPYFTCALLSTGTVQCWGDDAYGQLGDKNQSTSSPTPVTASVEANPVFDIATSYYSTCVVLGSGIVQCWGSNSNGELGNGTTNNSTTPVTVTGITNAVRITAGNEFFCATLLTGAVNCWGLGTSGQLGNQSAAQQNSPIAVKGLSGSVLKAVGGGLDGCALLTGGAINCWGDNTYGQLGNDTSTPTLSVVSVYNLAGATDLSVGTSSACALVGSTVKCWGYNAVGQLGNATTTSSGFPVAVSNISTANGVGSGAYHNCASLTTGAVECWGYNNNGQLGNGTITSSSVPVVVTGVN